MSSVVGPKIHLYKVEDAGSITEALLKKGATRRPKCKVFPIEAFGPDDAIKPNKPPVWDKHDKADSALRKRLKSYRIPT